MRYREGNPIEVHAEWVRAGGAPAVKVSRKGEGIASIYMPDTPSYQRWAELADAQAKQDGSIT